MRPDTITLAIEEKLTAEEKAEIAGSLAIAVADVETISGEKKVSDAAFNERIKRAEEQITQLAKRYNKGCETAQVGCDIRYDSPEVGKKQYVRMDTGEVAETHDMNWEEKQETIQFPIAQPTDEQVNAALSSISDDVTRMCEKTAGCIHFAEHDGPCETAPAESQAKTEEPRKRRNRKSKTDATAAIPPSPSDEPQPGAGV